MKQIQITSEIGHYPVIVGNGVLHHIKDYVNEQDEVLIITDDNVKKFHLDQLLNELPTSRPVLFSLGEHPERKKNLTTVQEVLQLALDHHLSRQTKVLAFGGGAVGDFAGFFATIYKRGVSYLQIPTTILAHDSSVGGKVAVNFQSIKNIVGQFYAPLAVIYDMSFLKTLPLKEVKSGFAELIKHDLLENGSLVEELLNLSQIDRTTYFNQLDLNTIATLIEEAIVTKYSYIKDDIWDKLGKRAALNLGHTLGHAIEHLYDYTHGEAILLGICFSLFLTNPEQAKQYYDCFHEMGYFNEQKLFDIDKIINQMKHDKKNQQKDKVQWITLPKIGNPQTIALSTQEIKEKLVQFLNTIGW